MPNPAVFFLFESVAAVLGLAAASRTVKSPTADEPLPEPLPGPAQEPGSPPAMTGTYRGFGWTIYTVERSERPDPDYMFAGRWSIDAERVSKTQAMLSKQNVMEELKRQIDQWIETGGITSPEPATAPESRPLPVPEPEPEPGPGTSPPPVHFEPGG